MYQVPFKLLESSNCPLTGGGSTVSLQGLENSGSSHSQESHHTHSINPKCNLNGRSPCRAVCCRGSAWTSQREGGNLSLACLWVGAACKKHATWHLCSVPNARKKISSSSKPGTRHSSAPKSSPAAVLPCTGSPKLPAEG